MVKFARYANFKAMKTEIVLALAVVMFISTSCDMFRKIAGRPTSDEIEARRSEIVRANEKIAALKQRQKACEDSLALVDSIRRMETAVRSLSEVGDLYTTSLESRITDTTPIPIIIRIWFRFHRYITGKLITIQEGRISHFMKY